MATLRNFALGTVVAALLVGPTAWADAHQPLRLSLPSSTANITALPQLGTVISAFRAALPFHF